MQLQTLTTQFHGQPVQIIDHAGQRWLTAKEAGLCLGYNPANASQGIINLYNRHADEFTEADTCVINLMAQWVPNQFDLEPSKGGNPNVRIFSATGCQLLGFFANTDRAKQFRAWAKQVLASEMTGQPHFPAPTQKGRSGRAQITRQVEFDVLTLFIQGLSQKDISRQVGISTSTVCQLLHARYRFTPDAGEDITTPALLQAVVARHISEERARLTKKYCASAANRGLEHYLDGAGQGLLGGH